VNAQAQILEMTGPPSPLCSAFMKWQCRVRQIAMRDDNGRPDDGITPAVYLPSQDHPLGYIVTILCKSAAHSRTPELQHLFKHTNDPAERREKALQLLSDSYYQKHREFSDMLTATFAPDSSGAAAMLHAAHCRLAFEAYGQRFDLHCTVTRLLGSHPNYQATWWHNLLFNPNLDPETVMLGFTPDWSESSSIPEINIAS